jgi:separase
MVRAAGSQKTTRFKLDDAIVECLAALPSTSREEDLEDLFYYAAESFHFSGVPLAHDETDVDQVRLSLYPLSGRTDGLHPQVVVDLREALEELHGSKSAPKRVSDPDEHTFLILDKTLHSFPWESLPCLLGRSVSRLPSLAFLRDRLDLAASQSSSTASSDPEQSYDLVINPSKAAFVLNPGGDLKNTQKTFEPWLEERKKADGWSGVTARAPLEEEMKASLSQKELFLCVYFSFFFPYRC